MSMFSHSAIASLNNLEMMVYNTVIKNRDQVMYMTIRELADAAGVSTTTVLRFCRKMQCDGWSARAAFPPGAAANAARADQHRRQRNAELF